MPEVHAKASASHSHVWLNCTKSLSAEEGIKDKPSVFAREGTLAHSLAELRLGKEFGKIDDEAFQTELESIKADELWKDEMWDYISIYIDRVKEVYNSFAPDSEINFEKRLDYSRWVQEGFGTGDVVIAGEGHYAVIDLKYGAGLKISAEENPQLMIYGLGLIDEYELAYTPGMVEAIIVQPRLDHMSSYSIKAEDLVKWGDEVVKPRAELALAGEGEFAPGEWCDKYFCKARHICRARANEALEIAKKKFADPDTLTEEELGTFLEMADRVCKWCDNLKTYALDSIMDGTPIEGWKVVAGRSTRKVKDEDGLVDALVKDGFDKPLLFTSKLIGITDLEKLVGKKAFAESYGEYVVKSEGKPTLAPAGDKREAIDKLTKARDRFSEEEI